VRTESAGEQAPGPKKTAEAAKVPTEAVKLRFNFRFQPWKAVLDWMAQQAGFSLVMDSPPPGTFNYSDDRQFTPAEAVDLLNSVLLTKGYTLVRRERMLMLVNLQDGIPANLVGATPEEELDKKGEFEIVSVAFDLARLSPEEAESEIKKLLGPQGSVVVLPQSRQIQVTDTGGRLRSIRRTLRRIEEPAGGAAPVRAFDLKNVVPQNVMDVLRQLLDIPADRNVSSDGSIRLALDATNQRLLISGKPDKSARAEEILKALDVPAAGTAAGTVLETPQLEVYPITGADSDSTLKVMQTLMAGQPDVRLRMDP